MFIELLEGLVWWLTFIVGLNTTYEIIHFKIIIYMFVYLFDDVQHPFQQYFSYIVMVSFIGGETGGPGENHRPVAIR